jgi:hypothetical protein
MYKGTPNTDPEKIKTALWGFLHTAFESTKDELIDVSGTKIFVSNRPAESSVSTFAIVDVNGSITDFDGYARCVCLVQLFARDIDNKGTTDMVKLSQLYDTMVSALPYNDGSYTFSKKNQVGRRDVHGFHSTMVNLDCLIL